MTKPPSEKTGTAPARAARSTTGKVRRTQAERTEETRRRLLDAAVEVMASKGYSGFRTVDVADAAGVSRGAMTHHFPSKDELVVALVEDVFKRAAELGHKRAGRFDTVGDAIKALIVDSREFFFSELFLIAMDLAIQGRMNTGSSQLTEISAASRLPVEESWLGALIDSGVPESVAEDLLWLTLSIVRGLAVRRLWQQDPTRFNRLFRLWREMVESYLQNLPPAAPARRPRTPKEPPPEA